MAKKYVKGSFKSILCLKWRYDKPKVDDVV